MPRTSARPAFLLAALFLATAARAEPAPPARAVLDTYATMAQAMTEDAVAGARDLDRAVAALLAAPSPETLKAAREAWIRARIPYMQTEGYRFGNKAVDALEGKVNAWPLDEGLIDYVDTAKYGEASDENPLFRANVVANPRLRIGRRQVDATTIDADLLETLHEAQGIEANVATGYHAVEFLLWGQDLNGTGPGAGNRPASDYAADAACTHGHCDRRRAYLKAASALLVRDLQAMADLWGPNGQAREELARKGETAGLATILTGLGSLSYGEMAGERMKLGLTLHDPEEEQDCFSDNTHNAHWYDQVGITAIATGRYLRTDGRVVEGPSLMAYAAAKAPEEARRLDAALTAASERIRAIKDRADSGIEAYDQMIGEGNAEGNRIIQAAIDALVAQTRAIEALVSRLGLAVSVEGSDSLDNPGAVGKKR
jgi:putative iron-regulated protein